MTLFQSRAARTAFQFFTISGDLIFAVDAKGIVRGSCNPAALNALRRHDSIFPNGRLEMLRDGSSSVQAELGNLPAIWRCSTVGGTDIVLVVCSTELGRLIQAATTDPLTGLANKRQFLEDISKSRQESCLGALLLIDIDHFKLCNDRYGHVVGDKVLAAVGQVVAKHTRPEDRSYRYGGEEIAVRMDGLINDPQFSLTIVCSRAEAIRADVERLCFASITEPITVSIGFALYPHHHDLEEYIQKADQALYYAKQHGRNRVISFDDVPAKWLSSRQPSVVSVAQA